jgi:hypothetical protein
MGEVGFLVGATTSDWATYIGAFRQKMPSGTNITFLPPGGAGGDLAKITAAAKYFAQNAFDVVVTAGTEAAKICQTEMQANQRQFVFASVGDPAISGLIPTAGGNFTGGSNLQVTLVQARVTEMLKPVHNFQAPFAVVGNYNNEPIKSAMTLAFNLLSQAGPTQLAPLTPPGQRRHVYRQSQEPRHQVALCLQRLVHYHPWNRAECCSARRTGQFAYEDNVRIQRIRH